MKKVPDLQSYGEKWTVEQKEAIFLQGKDILVTAGAGSGKTRVLVERLLNRITDRENPVDLDRLLVVTFTKAAASEMKQRIGIALEKALQHNPRSQNLQRQLLLLNRATITTVHSFCLDVIRRYYYLKNLDPSFRVLDETAAELLRQEILEEILDEYYDTQNADSGFYRLVDAYSSDRGDQALQHLVMRVYSFAKSHPFPGLWLQKKRDVFRTEFAGARNYWIEPLMAEFREELEMITEFLKESIRIASAPGGPTPYLDTLSEEINLLREIKDASHCSWDKLFETIQQNPFGRLKPCRGEAYDPEMKGQALSIRERAKKDLLQMKNRYFQRSLDDQLKELEVFAPLLASLVELVEIFDARYLQAKKERGVADFSDLEHFALQILTDEECLPGMLTPSRAALEYRQYFAEIMVDEYQDINQVQEAILELISLPEPRGNRFMVGDVKQSIYRFRLAEPELFLKKQRTYTEEFSGGRCIHLHKNFRSRKEILAGINFLFSRIMDETVGEIEYDDSARLHYGGLYPDVDESRDRCIDLLLIHRSQPGNEEQKNELAEGSEDDEQNGANLTDSQDDEEWENASLEGQLIAQRIKRLLGEESGCPLNLYNRKSNSWRKVTYRDIAILLRSTKNFAPAILDELKRAGIPAYAELGSGFFDAVEIKVMLSLLAIVDNPFQDLPLVAVLRSPILGLKAEELALIRTAAPSGSFFDALISDAALEALHQDRREKLQSFLHNLERWQQVAVRVPLVDLIRQIYRETGYYDLVGGMPGGKQRQANLRALFDRARLYEASSARGLFRFLSFVEKLKGRGEDLEAASILGEQENVVRILTVHKSKGLEFPVVFLAGLNRSFNQKDLHHSFLLHKELGFGPKYIDTEKRFIYPTLPWFALKKRLHAELLAEEMRILYVAMTRAEEKLILLATVNNLEEKLGQWDISSRSASQFLPTYFRSRTKSCLDWIGPALFCHPGFERMRKKAGKPLSSFHRETGSGISSWNVFFFTAVQIIAHAAHSGKRTTEHSREKEKDHEKYLHKISRLETLLSQGDENLSVEVSKRLSWRYPRQWSTTHYAKVSVSELPKLNLAGLNGKDNYFAPGKEWGQSVLTFFRRRPGFLEEIKLTPAERGIAYHTAMQHLKLNEPLNEKTIRQQLKNMLSAGHLDTREHDAVDPLLIAEFFATSLGKRLISAFPSHLWRELPFTLVLPAEELYDEKTNLEGTRTAQGNEDDFVLVQGVIDCLFRENDRLVLIDFKTGNAFGLEKEKLRHQYFQQLYYYSLAIERIWKAKVREKYLYFFDGGSLLEFSEKTRL